MALSVWRAVAWHGLSVGLSVVRLSRGPVCLPVVVHHYLSEPQFPTLRSAQWWTIRPPAMGESDQTGNCGLDVEKANTIDTIYLRSDGDMWPLDVEKKDKNGRKKRREKIERTPSAVGVREPQMSAARQQASNRTACDEPQRATLRSST
jgi:hypothetical protein